MQYIFKGESHTDTSTDYLTKLGIDSETVESIQRQEVYELAKEEQTEIAIAKQYLIDTDFKMTVDYDQDVADILVLRAAAREFIRSKEYV